MTEFNKRDCIIIITIGVLMIVGGGILFMYKFPNIENVVIGCAYGSVGAIFTLFGNDLYKAVKSK